MDSCPQVGPIPARSAAESILPHQARMRTVDVMWTAGFSLVVSLAVLGNTAVLWVVLGQL